MIRTAVLLSLLATTISFLSADDPTEIMTSQHVAKIADVTSAVISPDGKHTAYTLSVPRNPLEDEDGPAFSELHVVDHNGRSRPFITGKVSIGKPHWSSDSKWIFYSAKRNDDKHNCVYRIAVDGGESIKTFANETSIESFDISLDGKQIAFLAKRKSEDDVTELEDKGFDQEIYEEDWKTTYTAISDLDLDSTAANNGDQARFLELKGSAVSAQWSPDGTKLLVVQAPSPSIDDRYMFKRAFVVEAESGDVIRSLDNPGKLGDLAWSPDSKRVAIVSGEDINDPREGRLFVASLDGPKQWLNLLPRYAGHVAAIAWVDNENLIYLASEGVSCRIGNVDLKGKIRETIQPGGSVVFSGLSLASTGDVALVGHRREHPHEVFMLDRSAVSARRVTEHNAWLKTIRFAKQQRVEWKARDGKTMEGVLVYPLDHQENQRYPTIMYVHGGPESHESNGWLTSYSRPGQVAAAMGFAVFYPNYRGSTGRGVEFSKLGQADAAGAEFDDLVDGIDHLIKIGITKKDAVGVTGGSYGGYASAWCSTYYSERFAASAMFVGISDNISKVGTTDIPEEMFLVHHRKRLWDDWDYFLDRSPIRYVERNQTATLILHGKLDPRVHPSQSLELHRHLKTLGKAPVRLVLYEGEGHGNRKAAARLDYNLRMLRWMKHFLIDDAEKAPEYSVDYRAALGATKSE